MDISTALVETGNLCPVVVQVIITQPDRYSGFDVAFGRKPHLRTKSVRSGDRKAERG